MSVKDYSGQVLDQKYRLEEVLGRGGMGSVYLGEHTLIGRQVAIKILHADLATSTEMVKRFYREARAAAAIRHRNIIDVLDVGLTQWGDPYLVMEFLEGESLGGLLERSGPLGLATTCGVIEPVLLALIAVHEKGIVHRDLKPDNTFLARSPGAPPEVKLIDFGISKFTGGADQTKLTQTGTMMGTPAYMAPEQARGVGQVDARADIYSVGVMMYQMLTGRLPFSGETYNDLIAKVLTEKPRPPADSYSDFPDAATPTLMKAIAKDPADRFASAVEMLDAIRKFAEFGKRAEQLSGLTEMINQPTVASGDLGGAVHEQDEGDSAAEVFSEMTPGASTPALWPQKTDRRARTRRWPYVAAGVIGALALAGATGLWIFSTSESQVSEMPAHCSELPAAVCDRYRTAAADPHEMDRQASRARKQGEIEKAICLAQMVAAEATDPELLGRANYELHASWKARGCQDLAHRYILRSIGVRPKNTRGFEIACRDCAKLRKGDCGRCDDNGAGQRFLASLPDRSGPVVDDLESRKQLNKGRRLERDGKHDAAIAAYRKSLEFNPASSKAYGEIAYALKNAGRFEESEAVGRRALEMPGNAKFRSNVYFNLGWVMQETGSFEEAAELYIKALQMNPDNSHIEVKLAEVRQRLGR
jgi:serine/threonine protein kinase